MSKKISYPVARRDELVVDDYHGVKVPDVYRWLEDPDSEETKAFVDVQNAVTMPYLKDCPSKDEFHEKLKAMWDYPKYSCPSKHGDRFFYYYNTGLQNQSVLYVQDSLEGEARVFLDPNALSEDGTVALSTTSFSEDGSVFSYGLSKSGSDWITIKFRKTCDATDLPDVLKQVKFSSMAWTHDGKGIFYNRYLPDGKSDGTETDMNVNQKLFYHKLGTEQEEDVLCGECPEHPKWMIGADISDCGNYLMLTPREGCDPVNRLYITDLRELKNGFNGILPYKKIVDNFDAEYEYITNEGSVFTFKTNLKAPKYRLIRIDVTKPDPSNWEELVAEREIDVLEWVACVKGSSLVLCYLSHVKNVLYLGDLATGAIKRQLPLEVGTISGYSGKKKDSEIFYKFVSFTTPGQIYRCPIDDVCEPKLFREMKVAGYEASEFVTSQVFYKSKDGTKIPMFIVHSKNMKKDGKNPVLLYGYGGFNISITPSFSVSRTVFMRHLGGVVAVANIRGGGEYGKDWHKAGCYGKKQNVFDDFHAAAEYLVASGYTNNKRIAINGGSNGGLLVGACANQRPDLYGCVLAQVGVMDMLRFHKFTIGHAWTTDFGCSDKAEDFQWLHAYSPVHNVPDISRCTEVGGYPATLLLTGDHDDRVVPLHSLKFMAQLHHRLGQEEKQTNPLMIRIDTKSGHGAGKPTAKVLEELTDIYSFVSKTLNLKWDN